MKKTTITCDHCGKEINGISGYTDMVDACTMCTKLNIPVHMVPGNRGNIKVTTPEDVYSFRALLQYRENEQAFGLGLTNQPRINHAIDITKKG